MERMVWRVVERGWYGVLIWLAGMACKLQEDMKEMEALLEQERTLSSDLTFVIRSALPPRSTSLKVSSLIPRASACLETVEPQASRAGTSTNTSTNPREASRRLRADWFDVCVCA